MPSEKSVIIGILGLIVAVYGWSFFDFSTSVDSMRLDIDQGSAADTSVEVHHGWFYDKDVIMRAESVPSYIHVNFEPELLKHENNSVSKIIVSAEKETPLGEYLIPIVSEGSDGKEHNFKLKVIVRSPQANEQTPTPSKGSISVYSSPISAKIEKTWTDYDIFENNLPGMRIHVMFNTHNLKNKNCNISAYFYCSECGEQLQDSNQNYCDSDGNVVSYSIFTPTDVDTIFKDFTLFMPYSELHPGIRELDSATHSDKLKFNIVISREEKILDVSDWEYFNYTQA